ncbi:unnamed protein product, partial [Polarella glacialis]
QVFAVPHGSMASPPAGVQSCSYSRSAAHPFAAPVVRRASMPEVNGGGHAVSSRLVAVVGGALPRLDEFTHPASSSVSRISQAASSPHQPLGSSRCSSSSLMRPSPSVQTRSLPGGRTSNVVSERRISRDELRAAGTL